VGRLDDGGEPAYWYKTSDGRWNVLSRIDGEKGTRRESTPAFAGCLPSRDVQLVACVRISPSLTLSPYHPAQSVRRAEQPGK
jgi:hypothetical protein